MQKMMSSGSGESPARRMLGRELRSRLDLLQEIPKETVASDCVSKFDIGQPVIVRDYRSAKSKWIPGRIMRNRGTRVCEVKVPQGSWTCHYEQIRPRIETQVQDEDRHQSTRASSLLIGSMLALRSESVLSSRALPSEKETEAEYKEDESADDFRSVGSSEESEKGDEGVSRNRRRNHMYNYHD